MLEVNTLVRHKKLQSLGIGCVSKIFKNNIAVNFGIYDCIKTKESMLEVIDTSKCKTISLREFQSRILNDKSTLNDVILGNEVLHFVGIGWTTRKEVVTEEDLKKYPRVIN